MNYTLVSILCLLLRLGCHAPAYQTTCQSDINRLTTAAPFDMPSVPVPSFPNRTFNVLDYGADANGELLSTSAFQSAIDVCSKRGGGTVVVPEGIYRTGPIVLKSNVRLFTEHNSLIIFSEDFNLYPVIETSFEGLDTRRCQSPISADGAKNIAVTGYGTFNGSGDAWRPLKHSKVPASQWNKKVAEGGVVIAHGDEWLPTSGAAYGKSISPDQGVPVVMDSMLVDGRMLPAEEVWEYMRAYLRPVMVHFVHCNNILLEGVCFENTPAWNFHPLMCENIICRNLHVRNPQYAQNGDGMDIESCRNVVITDCQFDVGDDAICMKSGKNEDGRRRGIPTENVVVCGCLVYHGHGGFVVGSEMSGGVRNIHVTNCLFNGTDVGLRFKSTRGRGGIVENIYIDHINMWGIPHEGLLFDLFYGGKAAGEENEEELAQRMATEAPAVSELTPQFRNIHISDIRAGNIHRAMYFNGLPEMKIYNVNLSNIHMDCAEGALIRQTDSLVVSDVTIVPEHGMPFVITPSVTRAHFSGTHCGTPHQTGSLCTSFWRRIPPNDSLYPDSRVIEAEGQTRHITPVTSWTADPYVDTYHELHHHGVAVESSLMAYRIYFDKKQTVDVYCKRTPRLELPDTHWYPSVEQLAEGFGDDILRVSGTVGVGSVKPFDGERMRHVEDVQSRTQRIVECSTEKAVMEVEVKGWKTEGKTVDMKVRYTLLAGHRDMMGEVFLSEPLERLCTGVMMFPGGRQLTEFFSRREDCDCLDDLLLGSWGTDWPQNDTVNHPKQTVGLGVYIPKEYVNTNVSDAKNNLALFAPRTYLRFYLATASLMENNPPATTAEEFFAYLRKWRDELQ